MLAGGGGYDLGVKQLYHGPHPLCHRKEVQAGVSVRRPAVAPGADGAVLPCGGRRTLYTEG
jgi:hypothetical protein